MALLHATFSVRLDLRRLRPAMSPRPIPTYGYENFPMQATAHEALLRLIAEVIPDSAGTLPIDPARRGSGGELHGAPLVRLYRAAKTQCREVLVNGLIVLELS